MADWDEKLKKLEKEIKKLKEDLAFHKGISEGKSIIIKQLEEELKKLTILKSLI